MPWCMPGSLTSGFLLSRWRGKRSWHFRRMRNPQFYVSGKRIMESALMRFHPNGDPVTHCPLSRTLPGCRLFHTPSRTTSNGCLKLLISETVWDVEQTIQGCAPLESWRLIKIFQCQSHQVQFLAILGCIIISFIVMLLNRLTKDRSAGFLNRLT